MSSHHPLPSCHHVIPSSLSHPVEVDDYVLQTRSFTYTGGTSGREFTFVVDVLADDTFEGSEQFELALNIHQGFQDRGVALGNPSMATVTIEDTDGTLHLLCPV